MLYEVVGEDAVEESSYMDLLPFLHTPVASPTAVVDQLAALPKWLEAARQLLVALFNTDVEKKIAMDVYKGAAKLPVSISADVIHDAVGVATSALNTVLTTPAQGSA